MAWETVDNPKPIAVSKSVPPDGVAISTRRAMKDTHYLVLRIGAALAAKSAILQPEQRLRLMVGSGSDKGKMCVMVDAQAGPFLAKRQKAGSYVVTVSARAAEGLFSLTAPPFERAGSAIEVIRPTNGQPVHFVFRPDPALFKLEEDA